MIILEGGFCREDDHADRDFMQPIQARDDVDEPAPRSAGRSALRVALPGLAVLALVGVVGQAPQDWRSAGAAPTPDGARLSDPSRPFVPSAASSARPAVPVAASAPRYRLDDPEGLDPVRMEPARIHPVTESREDSLSQGSFVTSEAPYLRITVSDGPPGAASLFVTIARRAADGQGLAVVKTGERGLIETKFGPVDTLEVTLSGAVTRICSAFSNAGQSGLVPLAPRFDGWLCAPLGLPPEPRSVACALDKLVLNGQASTDLDATYRVFEARRLPGCGSATAPKREPAGVTGSISKSRPGRIEAKLRRAPQTRP